VLVEFVDLSVEGLGLLGPEVEVGLALLEFGGVALEEGELFGALGECRLRGLLGSHHYDSNHNTLQSYHSIITFQSYLIQFCCLLGNPIGYVLC